MQYNTQQTHIPPAPRPRATTWFAHPLGMAGRDLGGRYGGNYLCVNVWHYCCGCNRVGVREEIQIARRTAAPAATDHRPVALQATRADLVTVCEECRTCGL